VLIQVIIVWCKKFNFCKKIKRLFSTLMIICYMHKINILKLFLKD